MKNDFFTAERETFRRLRQRVGIYFYATKLRLFFPLPSYVLLLEAHQYSMIRVIREIRVRLTSDISSTCLLVWYWLNFLTS